MTTVISKDTVINSKKKVVAQAESNLLEVPEGVDSELLAKVLSNPEMAALLTSLAKSMNK